MFEKISRVFISVVKFIDDFTTRTAKNVPFWLIIFFNVYWVASVFWLAFTVASSVWWWTFLGLVAIIYGISLVKRISAMIKRKI